MSVKTYTFANGTDAVPGYGQKSIIQFGGTWLEGEYWTALVDTGEGNLTLGKGWWDGTATCCFTFKNRVYVGLGSRFVFCQPDNAMGWEEQNDGAGGQDYLSQVSGQDEIKAFSQLQGRLAVIARNSIQLWTVDADPAQFALVQALENTGTNDPLSVQNMGDYDVLYLSDSGLRSLRAKEATLNAGVDDIGSSIDPLLTEASLVTNRLCCGIVDTISGNYWLFLYDRIYVLSNHPASKVEAWSTYLATDDSGVAFTPQKFVVYERTVFCRGVEGGLYIYGGTGGNLYDGSVVTCKTPWLESRKPVTLKKSISIEAIFSGRWTVRGSMDPKSATLETICARGSEDTPDATQDSTLVSNGSMAFFSLGTHYMFEFYTSAACLSKQVFSAIVLKDQQGNII